MYLVTGATGFVGGHMVDLLLASNLKVRALVRNEQKALALTQRGVEVIIGDLTDDAALKKAVTGVQGVFHIGATFREPHLKDEDYFKINQRPTEMLLKFSEEAGVERFIYCSTSGVLGSIKELPGTEKTPYNPGDVYQESKLAGEKAVLSFLETSKLKGAIIRPAMIYGPRDTRFLKIFKMIKGGKFFYVGPGEALVHFIDVRDLVKAFLLVMENKNINREIFTIAGSNIYSLREVIEKVASHLKVKAPWLHIPISPMHVAGSICEAICKPFGISPPLYRRRVDFFTKDRCFSTKKAREMLGFQPSKGFDDELNEILSGYQKLGDL